MAGRRRRWRADPDAAAGQASRGPATDGLGAALAATIAGGALGGALGGAYATRVEPYRPVLRRRWVAVPASWPPLEILHLSDLHLRRGDPRLARAQRSALASLPRQPDLVCLTGDLCEQLGDAACVADVLQPLRPRLGTVAVLGNHEYGPDAAPPVALRHGFGGLLWRVFRVLFRMQRSAGAVEADAIAAALEQDGLTVLRNRGLRLTRAGRSVWVAGADSAWAGRADIHAALVGRAAADGALALVHEPEGAFAAVEAGADLVLAGHTHGGQVRLPVLGAPYTHRVDPRVRVAAGLQAIGPATLHVSAGLGQLLPLRFLCPPEMVWLRCQPPAAMRPAGRQPAAGQWCADF